MSIIKSISYRYISLAFVSLFLAANIGDNIALYAQTRENAIKGVKSNHLNKSINELRQLYENGMYEAVIAESKNILSSLPIAGSELYVNPSADEIEGYAIMSAVKLEKPNIEGLISEYEGTYPYSSMLIKIKLVQADLYFSKKDYANSYKHFSGINPTSLNIRDLDEYFFKIGFSAIQIGAPKEALEYLKKTYNSNNSSIRNAALYYSGYIYYRNKNFAEAVKYFDKVLDDEKYASLASSQILESKLLLNDYDYVISNGDEIYLKADDNSKAKIARMISEAYYAKERPDKAKYYFELYSLGEGSLSHNDIFYAGMISYNVGEYISAIDSFSKVASENDSLGQSAYYHLGESYIKVKNKRAAQEAFKHASACNIDKSIQEDAFFNYAKLSFDLDRNMVPFNEYLSKFSCTESKKEEIYNYMSASFLMNKDYESAINVLKSTNSQKPYIIANLQKATFMRGMELIENNSYKNASQYMKAAVNYGSKYKSALTDFAKYWLAECYFRGNGINKATELFEELESSQSFRKTDEYPLLSFNLGYCHLKEGEYAKAISKFENYLKLIQNRNIDSKSSKTKEVRIRIADCNFFAKNYVKAAELYEKSAIDSDYKDLYPALQASISYGLISQTDKKIALLNEITTPSSKNSPLYTNALYELGRSLVQISKEDEAENVFHNLVDEPADSIYYYKALLEMGMINTNAQRYDKALDYYKRIISQSSGSEEAQSALAGIENIYQTQGRSDEFISYIDNLGISADKAIGDKEKLIFNSAEQAFMNNNYSTAINSLRAYLQKYPDGVKTQQAYFYLGESYDKTNKKEQAADAYYNVMLKGEGAFSELSTLKYGKLSLDLERYDEALKAFETLDYIAKLSNNKIEANIGKMRALYNLKEYKDAISQADRAINTSELDKNIIEEARLIRAKSNSSLGMHAQAINDYKALSAYPNSAYGAEANYMLISDAFESGRFSDVEKLTFAFSDSNTTHSYWLAKSFIILGDSYTEQNNIEQAKATYTSIIQNYKSKNQDEIHDLAKQRLDKINKKK